MKPTYTLDLNNHHISHPINNQTQGATHQTTHSLFTLHKTPIFNKDRPSPSTRGPHKNIIPYILQLPFTINGPNLGFLSPGICLNAFHSPFHSYNLPFLTFPYNLKPHHFLHAIPLAFGAKEEPEEYLYFTN